MVSMTLPTGFDAVSYFMMNNLFTSAKIHHSEFKIKAFEKIISLKINEIKMQFLIKKWSKIPIKTTNSQKCAFFDCARFWQDRK